jgi:3-methyladenine DNA glycosylase AlkD
MNSKPATRSVTAERKKAAAKRSVSAPLSLTKLRQDIRTIASSERAAVLRRYFKTGPGEYAEGDIFIGLTVPQIRTLARQNSALDFSDIESLLTSAVHEERSLALMLLVARFNKGNVKEKKEVYGFYMRHLDRVNNWDLVDGSADRIVGAYHFGGSPRVIEGLAKSPNLWRRRVAVLATFHNIKQRDFELPLRIITLLLDDPHPLIHKATGWMLREIGNRDREQLEQFLDRYGTRMPRTTLRYAIERFDKRRRAQYLARKRIVE